jgi:hypothetical protein
VSSFPQSDAAFVDFASNAVPTFRPGVSGVGNSQEGLTECWRCNVYNW